MRYTYLTVLSTDNYLDGILVLDRSLRLTNATYPLLVLLGSAVSTQVEETLRQRDIATRRIEGPLHSLPDAVADRIKQSPHPHWLYSLEKLMMFDQDDYDKIVYIDSDMLVLDNLDTLFSHEDFSAVAAGISLYPDWVGLNSGLMVICPMKDRSAKILSVLPQVMKSCPYFGDQDLLHAYMPDWPSQTALHLDERYNALFGFLPFYVRKKSYTLFKPGYYGNIAIVHFTGRIKPWTKPLPLAYRFKLLLKSLGCPSYGKVFRLYRQMLKELR